MGRRNWSLGHFAPLSVPSPGVPEAPVLLGRQQYLGKARPPAAGSGPAPGPGPAPFTPRPLASVPTSSMLLRLEITPPAHSHPRHRSAADATPGAALRAQQRFPLRLGPFLHSHGWHVSLQLRKAGSGPCSPLLLRFCFFKNLCLLYNFCKETSLLVLPAPPVPRSLRNPLW